MGSFRRVDALAVVAQEDAVLAANINTAKLSRTRVVLVDGVGDWPALVPGESSSPTAKGRSRPGDTSLVRRRRSESA